VPPLWRNLSTLNAGTRIMTSVTTNSTIDGYRVTACKGRAQGATFEEMLHHAEGLGANAILNVRYDNALGGEALFHGNAAVIEPIRKPTEIGK